jgi:hypothetical protein
MGIIFMKKTQNDRKKTEGTPFFLNRLYEQKVTWSEPGLLAMLFGYFLVRSSTTNSKISLNQNQNPSFHSL